MYKIHVSHALSARIKWSRIYDSNLFIWKLYIFTQCTFFIPTSYLLTPTPPHPSQLHSLSFFGKETHSVQLRSVVIWTIWNQWKILFKWPQPLYICVFHSQTMFWEQNAITKNFLSYYTDARISMFTETLFMVSRKCNQPRYYQLRNW